MNAQERSSYILVNTIVVFIGLTVLLLDIAVVRQINVADVAVALMTFTSAMYVRQNDSK